MYSAAARWRSVASVEPAAGAHELEQVGGRRAGAPHRPGRRERDALVGERDLGEPPSLALLADAVLLVQAGVVEEDLIERVGGRHVDDRRQSHAGQVHRHDEVRQPLVLRDVGVGACDQDPELGVMAAAGPDLGAVEHVLVAVANGTRGEAGEIAPGIGLAEQLAPVLVAAEDRIEEALALPLRSGEVDRRRRPSDADRVGRHRRAAHAAGTQLVVDDQLMDRIGVETPRRRPVGHDVPRRVQVGVRRVGVGGDPRPHRQPAWVVVGRHVEIHCRESSRAGAIGAKPVARCVAGTRSPSSSRKRTSKGGQDPVRGVTPSGARAMSSLRTTFLTASFRPRRTCMKLDPSTFLRSVAGKAVLATGVVLLAFGGAAAAGFTDVPSLLPSGDEPTLQDTSERRFVVGGDRRVERGVVRGRVVGRASRRKPPRSRARIRRSTSRQRTSRRTDESSAEDESSVDESSDDSATDEPTHGEVVSEFARTTELEGCEKGQAISDLASSNATDHRQNPESDHNPCDHESDDESADDSSEDSAEASDAAGEEDSADDSRASRVSRTVSRANRTASPANRTASPASTAVRAADHRRASTPRRSTRAPPSTAATPPIRVPASASDGQCTPCTWLAAASARSAHTTRRRAPAARGVPPRSRPRPTRGGAHRVT